jgi:hypothetical protein
MDAETAGKTIQLILAPVVMVTACAGFLNGLLSRYGAINDRLRALARERLDLLESCGVEVAKAAGLARERLVEIDTQVPALLRRHRKVRDSVLVVYAAIVVFVVSMFVIALAAAFGSTPIAIAALIVFLAATTLLLVGAVISVLEVRISHEAMHYEMHRVLELGRSAP